MPLAVGYTTPPPPDDGGGGRPPEPILGDRIAVTWTAPDGSVWPLTQDDLPWHLQNAAAIFGATPIAMVTDPYPLYGAKVRHIQPQPRTLTLPLQVREATSVPFRQSWRRLGNAFAQTRRLGPGTLQVQYADGSARQIAAHYLAGFDGQQGSGWYEDTAVIALFCEDPFWSDLLPTVISRKYVSGATPFLAPFFTVSSSQTLGHTVITNGGDAEAWPVWTITGPASGVDAANNTTGEAFSVDPNATGIGHGNLLTGETVTITTQRPSVRGPDGTIWTAALNWPGASLWGLAAGDNDVNFTVTGSGAGTSISLAFYARYEMA